MITRIVNSLKDVFKAKDDQIEIMIEKLYRIYRKPIYKIIDMHKYTMDDEWRIIFHNRQTAIYYTTDRLKADFIFEHPSYFNQFKLKIPLLRKEGGKWKIDRFIKIGMGWFK